MQPTQETYSELQQAFDFFNENLFQGSLPLCLLTLQRQKNTFGYFALQRFVRDPTAKAGGLKEPAT